MGSACCASAELYGSVASDLGPPQPLNQAREFSEAHRGCTQSPMASASLRSQSKTPVGLMNEPCIGPGLSQMCLKHICANREVLGQRSH